MGKLPGRWIKNLLLGKKSSKSNLSEGKENNLSPQEDFQSLRFEKAATKAQAAFRGYLGIIRLQALICGCLVRRQAVATLCSAWGIVKFQALVRGQKVAKSSSELSASARVKNLSNNAFVRKKLSNGKVENGSNHASSENEKHKRNPRKVSTNPADPVREQPQNEIEKVKRNLRKIPDSTKEISGRAEVNTETPNQTLMKTFASSMADCFFFFFISYGRLFLRGILLRRGMLFASAKISNLEANPKLSTAKDSVEESNTAPAVDSQPTESNGKVGNMHASDKQLNSKDGILSSENLNTGQRRASLPGKIDNKENGLYSTPKVPSYMAPTESVKAKLRGQGSPRFLCDAIEKNGVTRRHSLPSATCSNLSSLSPRAQRLVQASGKGAMRNDKSLSSSRDAGDKGIKADWRR
ncbi:hypothetical protein SLA2020_237580 [Shorea laevis]